jgi:hypothetical protein
MSFCSFSLVLNVAAFTFLAYREVTQRKRLRAKVKETAKKYQILMDGVQGDIQETINKLKAQRDDMYNQVLKQEALAKAAQEVKAAAEAVKPKRAYKKREAKDGDDPKKQK